MSLYRCVKCGNVDHLQITYPNGTHLLADGKHVEPLCTICLGKSWHNKMRMEKYDPQWHAVINPLNAQHKHEFNLRMGVYQTPSTNWIGYLSRKSGNESEDKGYSDTTDFNGLEVWQIACPEAQKSLFFFSILSDEIYDRVISADIEGLGSFIRSSGEAGGGINTHCFTDGRTNIYDWLSNRPGKTAKITIWETPAVKQNG